MATIPTYVAQIRIPDAPSQPYGGTDLSALSGVASAVQDMGARLQRAKAATEINTVRFSAIKDLIGLYEGAASGDPRSAPDAFEKGSVALRKRYMEQLSTPEAKEAFEGEFEQQRSWRYANLREQAFGALQDDNRRSLARTSSLVMKGETPQARGMLNGMFRQQVADAYGAEAIKGPDAQAFAQAHAVRSAMDTLKKATEAAPMEMLRAARDGLKDMTGAFDQYGLPQPIRAAIARTIKAQAIASLADTLKKDNADDEDRPAPKAAKPSWLADRVAGVSATGAAALRVAEHPAKAFKVPKQSDSVVVRIKPVKEPTEADFPEGAKNKRWSTVHQAFDKVDGLSRRTKQMIENGSGVSWPQLLEVLSNDMYEMAVRRGNNKLNADAEADRILFRRLGQQLPRADRDKIVAAMQAAFEGYRKEFRVRKPPKGATGKDDFADSPGGPVRLPEPAPRRRAFPMDAALEVVPPAIAQLPDLGKDFVWGVHRTYPVGVTGPGQTKEEIDAELRQSFTDLAFRLARGDVSKDEVKAEIKADAFFMRASDRDEIFKAVVVASRQIKTKVKRPKRGGKDDEEPEPGDGVILYEGGQPTLVPAATPESVLKGMARRGQGQGNLPRVDAVAKDVEGRLSKLKPRANETAVTPEGEKVSARFAFGKTLDGAMRAASDDDIKAILKDLGGVKEFGIDDASARRFAASVRYSPDGGKDGEPSYQIFARPGFLQSGDPGAYDVMAHEIGHVLQLLFDKDDGEALTKEYKDALPDLVRASFKMRGVSEWTRAQKNEALMFYLTNSGELLSDALAIYMRDPAAIRDTKAGKFLRRLINNSPELKDYIKLAEAETKTGRG